MRRLLPWSRSSVCCKLAKQGETLLFCFVRFFARLGFDEGAQRLFCRDAGYRSVFRADGIARRSFVMLKGKERCVALSDIEDSLNRISAQLTQIEKSLPPRYAWKRRFVLDLASGMARGIDGTAQRAAIKGGGKSYAVLGCGPDICYPMQNRDLYQNLLKNGGVLSEYPPGSSPLPFHFPMRNRIISGLSDLVIVIEAREKSGSLITADQALEQGRDVMVLPGRAGDALSAGCNRLIDQGAGIFLSTDQILERLKIKKKNHTNTKKTYIALESEENLVYSVLEFQAKNLQSIADETNLTPQKVSAILVRLMLCGLVAEDVKNHYSKV